MARMTFILFLLLLVAAPLYSAGLSGDQISFLDTRLIRVEAEQPFICQDPPYTVRLFSKEPLVVYLSGFISMEERTHLSKLDETEFEPSTVVINGKRQVDTGFRSSRSAYLSRDEVVRCIERRAQTFQGYGQTIDVEPLQVVKYEISDHVNHHYDYSAKNNRKSSIFAYLHTNCSGGGTNFPRLKAPINENWCEWIDCDGSYAAGITFKPIEGNAIFWQNIDDRGVMFRETLHAGLPVTSGRKVGLNIWTKGVATSLNDRNGS